MSEQNTPHTDAAHSDEGYERRDVRPRVVIYLGVAVTLTVIGTMIGLRMLALTEAPQARRDELPLPADELAPRPRLQATPNRDYAAFAAEQDRLLHSYGWVDRQRGIVRIPIEVALEQALEHGLPKRAAEQSEGVSAEAPE